MNSDSIFSAHSHQSTSLLCQITVIFLEELLYETYAGGYKLHYKRKSRFDCAGGLAQVSYTVPPSVV